MEIFFFKKLKKGINKEKAQNFHFIHFIGSKDQEPETEDSQCP